MISFHTNSVNSFFGTVAATTTTVEDLLPRLSCPVVYSPTSSPQQPPAATYKRAVETGYLHHHMGGSSITDGLFSCTESLGCESSDERTSDFASCSSSTDDDGSSLSNGGGAEELCRGMNTKTPVGKTEITAPRKELITKKKKNFPPPLSSLNHKGQRNFALRSVRSDGRLEIINEVAIDRSPEIMFATRQDGRLRLHLMKTVDDEDEEEQEETEFEGEKEELVKEEIGCSVEQQREQEELIDEQQQEDRELIAEDVEYENNLDDGHVEEEQEVGVTKTGIDFTGCSGERKVCGDGEGDGSRRCCSNYFDFDGSRQMRNGGHHQHGHHDLHIRTPRCVTSG